MAEPMARVQTYLHEGEQTKALTTLDIEISHSPSQSITPLLEAIESCGADYILQRCLSELKYDRWGLTPQSSSQTSTPSELEEFAYQAAWKLGQWDVKVPARQKKSVPFHQSLYHAMSSIRDGHLDVAKCAVEAARMYLVSIFDPKVENSLSLSPFLCQLQCLSHLDHVLESSLSESNISILADGCHDNSFDFEYIKPQLYLGASVGKILAERGSQSGEDLEVRALWSLAVCGRKAKSFQLAEKAVRELKTKDLSRTSRLSTEQLHMEEAKLFWARSEVNIAMSIMKTLITKLSQDQDPSTSCPPLMYAQALGTYGSWLAETKSSTPTVIISDYLEKTVTLMLKHRESIACDHTAPNSFMSLARFADEQYQQVADHMRSPTFQDKQNLLQRSRSELKECQGYGLRESKYLTVIEKNMKIDEEEITSMLEDRGRYLQQALVNYLRCLQHGDLHDLKVFRVVALWFDNCDNQEVNVLMKKNLKSIKSFKFLPLYYQLAARMSSTDNTAFQPVLTELMQRVAEDHPHHALWIILALAHAYKDDEILSQGSETTTKEKLSPSEKENAEVARVEAAKNLLELLKKKKAVSDIVENMELLCLAYIQLANSPASNRAGASTHLF
ncbi:unnamed protein product [Lymnaea stagnalis]|uniref:FAT domain-containing protein n=1 Tax=Lymnaea stagnalis TaxID=6523 RepID=A0AAV2HWG0_LYMST